MKNATSLPHTHLDAPASTVTSPSPLFISPTTELFHPFSGRAVTELQIPFGIHRISIWVEGHSSQADRYGICRAIYECLEARLKLRTGWIVHQDGNPESPRVRLSTKNPGIETEAESVGMSIRMKRWERGWTLAQLAERSQISKPHLSRIERGRVAAHESTRLKIAQALSAN